MFHDASPLQPTTLGHRSKFMAVRRERCRNSAIRQEASDGSLMGFKSSQCSAPAGTIG